MEVLAYSVQHSPLSSGGQEVNEITTYQSGTPTTARTTPTGIGKSEQVKIHCLTDEVWQ